MLEQQLFAFKLADKKCIAFQIFFPNISKMSLTFSLQKFGSDVSCIDIFGFIFIRVSLAS